MKLNVKNIKKLCGVIMLVVVELQAVSYYKGQKQLDSLKEKHSNKQKQLSLLLKDSDL